MGNFSRNTFNPDKNYVGVRLQQGVPLVDADWNELNDVIRQELYDGLSLAISDGVLPEDSLKIELVALPNQAPSNLKMLPGLALIGGRPLRVRAPIIYTDQPWFNNPTRAAQDGVAVIPPLTPPPGGFSSRTDLVYLDVWDREVKSTEDANLINPTIGIETCVRLKREVALRVVHGVVSEGSPPPALPPAPDGHFFMPLAHLTAAAGLIRNIIDIRPKVGPRGIRSVSFTPAFQPGQGLPTQLRLASDAPDQHIVDGVGEIPANGTSFCTMTLEKVALDGTPLAGEEQQGEIFLRTTGGVLMDAAGENRIRSVTLKSGRAAFRLVSEASPKGVTVSAFGQEPALLKAEIQIEFV